MGNFPYQPNQLDETIFLLEKEKLHHVKQTTLLCLSLFSSFPNKKIITTVQYKYLPSCLRGAAVSGFLRTALSNEKQQHGRCFSVCHDASLWLCIQAPHKISRALILQVLMCKNMWLLKDKKASSTWVSFCN